MYTRLPQIWRSTCFCLTAAGIKVMCHHYLVIILSFYSVIAQKVNLREIFYFLISFKGTTLRLAETLGNEHFCHLFMEANSRPFWTKYSGSAIFLGCHSVCSCLLMWADVQLLWTQIRLERQQSDLSWAVQW